MASPPVGHPMNEPVARTGDADSQLLAPDVTITDLLAEAAERWPARVALDFFGATTTYAELAGQVDRAASLLAASGVGAGDRVALILPNCPQHVVALYAVLRIGAVVAEHNPLAPTSELRAQLDHTGARVVVGWQTSVAALWPDGELAGRTVFAVDLSAALPRRSRLLLRLPIPPARRQRAAMCSPVPPGIRDWDQEVRRAGPLAAAHPAPTPEQTAVLLHTGGTTGVPKAAALTHRNIVTNVHQSITWVPQLRPGDETFFAVLPFFHAFGLTLVLAAGIGIGATVMLFPRFDVEALLAAMRRRPATFLVAVPPVFARLAQAAQDRGVDLTSIRVAISGAMSMPADVADHWERVTGGFVIEGYGMTEASPVILGNPVGPDRRPGALGIPYPGTQIRIVAPDDAGRDVPDGEIGELLARGPQVFAGYWDDPAETALVLDADGWLHTGDLVTRDASGFVTLADRRKELIISNGYNVYPSQVEDVVRSLPGVSDVAVVGLPDPGRGERVVAALVLEAGASVDLETVRRRVAQRLAPYAIPRAIAILEELPRSQIGKVLRRAVREHLLATPRPSEG